MKKILTVALTFTLSILLVILILIAALKFSGSRQTSSEQENQTEANVTQSQTPESQTPNAQTTTQAQTEQQKETKKTEKSHEHQYRAEKISATCTAQGYTKYICSCGDYYEDDFTDFGEHIWSFVSNTLGNCTEQGYSEYKCYVCGETKKDDFTDISHSYDTYFTHATCAEEGYLVCYCTICDYSYSEKVEDKKEHELDYAGICRLCSSDFGIDMKKLFGTPHGFVPNESFGFCFNPNNYVIQVWWEIPVLSEKEIKYASFEMQFVNSVGDKIHTEHSSFTGPFKRGDIIEYCKLISNYAGGVDFDTTAYIKISGIKIEYMDGTVERGHYGYATRATNCSNCYGIGSNLCSECKALFSEPYEVME